ncbi:MAG: Si-specific NAD(P)(+) transhydrogenase [Pseudomonadales bacterium]|nr:Si-specific NAD(P)(+) transhydrogenase [Pseudomonadales bacterium]
MGNADTHYDTVVIGSGPGGEAAAINLAKHGRRVAVVERHKFVGGACTHLGTIPSKALRHSVRRTIQFNTDPMFRSIGEPRIFTYQEVLNRAEKVIEKQVDLRTDFYPHNRIKLIRGHARFVDQNTLNIQTEDKVKQFEITADTFVVAVGSHPYRPSDVDFQHARVYSSDDILGMKFTPRSLIIYGAGVIGCEYASIFAGLGARVDLLNSRDRLLSFLDDEISDALGYQLRRSGVRIRNNEEYEKVEVADEYVAVQLKSGKVIKANALLWCNGRTGNTQNLGLENVELEADSRGLLKVDKCFRTKIPNIYAVGDVVGWPSLASASYDQGRAASFDILGKVSYWKGDYVPTGIYTIPEISSVGKNERELTAAKIPYEVGQANFRDTARGHISEEKIGMLKLLFHSETLEILGIHCFGDQAAEIIHIGQAIMSQKGEGNTIKYFTCHTFNYPTMAEAYRTAALDGLNRIRHRVPDKWDIDLTGPKGK